MSRLAFLGWPAGREERGGHLDDRIAALVDGELGHDARDRALAHVAECGHCLSRLEAERRLKAHLSSLAGPPVPDGLARRLLALAGPDGSGRDPRAAATEPGQGPRRGGTGRPPRLGAPVSGVTGLSGPGPRADVPRALHQRVRPRRLAALGAGLVCVAGAALGTAFVLGAPEQLGPAGQTPVLPPVATLTTSPGESADGSFRDDDPAVGAVRVALTGATFGGVLQPVDLEITAATRPVLVPAVPVRISTEAVTR